jgi:putative SOS response-associated peptidase YedK
LLEYFGVDLNIKPRLPLYNVAPTEPVPIIFEKSGERIAKFAVW